jgi:hypothetical protein
LKKITQSLVAWFLIFSLTNTFIYADEFSVDSPSTTQNDGNVLDGDDSLTITSNGSISTSANSDPAINMTGDNISIVNNGTISTTGSSSKAVVGLNYTTVTNTGVISTSVGTSYGIDLDDYAVVYNSGTIQTLSANSDAILVRENSIVTNTGTIITAGSGAEGIRVDEHSKIYNSGLIETTSEAILAVGDNVTIVNSGVIKTSQTNSDGIDIDNFNKLTNTGTISTVGTSSDAIFARSDNAIVNSGEILTSGTESNGISFSGNNNVIDNTGDIKVTGINSYAIGSNSDGSLVINNSGYIEGNNTGSYAVYNDDTDVTDTTLNLNNGSRILGKIDLGNNGGDTDTVNIYGGGKSLPASITINNAEAINLYASGVVIGDTVTTVDSTFEKSFSVGLVSLIHSVHNSIYKQNTRNLSSQATASNTNQTQASQTWVSAFGEIRNFSETDDNTAYEYQHFGVSTGYEWDQNNSRLGVMAGVASSSSESDSASFKQHSKHAFVGGYGVFNVGKLQLSTNLIAGYNDSDNERYILDNINGLETAFSDTNSVFISPSVSVMAKFKMGENYEIRPSANITYHATYIDGYKESGSTQSNLSVSDRYSQGLSSKVQLAIANHFSSEGKAEFRIGLNNRYIDDESVNAALNSAQFEYGIQGEEAIYGVYTGANLQLAKGDNLAFIADIELGSSKGSEEYVNASMKFHYSF